MSSFIQYMIIYFLIAVSANVWVMTFKWAVPILIILLLVRLIVRNEFKLNFKLIFLLLALILLQFLQGFTNDFLSWLTLLSTVGIYILAYFSILSVKGFDKKFVKLVVVLTTLSIVNTLLCFIPGYFDGMIALIKFLGTDPLENQNMFILTMENAQVFDIVHRNAGFVYEPGIFAFVLIIAQIFERKLSGTFDKKKSNILQIGLVTTFSTAGWAALILIFLVRIYELEMPKLSKAGIGLLMVVLSSWVFVVLPFLGGKIINQANSVNGKYYGNRAQSTLVDLSDISQSPWIGKGRNFNVRFDKGNEASDLEKHRTNGVTDMMVEYGLLYFICFILILNNSIRNYISPKSYLVVFLIFLTIIIIGVSQTIFSRPLLLTLLFLSSIRSDFEEKKSTDSIRLHYRS